MELTDDERAQITAAGRDPDAAQRQLDVLAGKRRFAELVRPATRGDGIDALGDLDGARAAGQRAAGAGRVACFVPASGAATRMFKDLIVAARQGDVAAGGAVAADVVSHVRQLACWPQLEAAGVDPDDPMAVVQGLVGEDGLGLHRLPKGLVPFHREAGGPRTALQAQLDEVVALAGSGARVRMSVPDGHQPAFTAQAEPCDVALELGVQDPATDTVARAEGGGLFRTDDGAILFRPGGHGALLGHLQHLADTGADLVAVKNIDNVAPDPDRAAIVAVRQALVGHLATLVGTAHAHVRALRGGGGLAAAAAFASRVLGAQALTDPTDPSALAALLDRPWRVAGMVRNEGQPGGGPFWVRDDQGVSLQIVEGAQIDGSDPAQAAILAGSTHFNPVDLVLALRRASGRPHRLPAFVDPDAVLVASKSHQGRPLTAYEHPGLWNGAMAGWNTVFVEIPAWTFRPVKTLRDLLTSAHGGPL